MEPISKEDLDNEIVKAVIEHYRTADPKVRIASLHGAIFVLKWQAAERLSGETLAKISGEGVSTLCKEIERAGTQMQTNLQQNVWTVLERLIAASDQCDGCNGEEQQLALYMALADAREFLARKRTGE